MAIKVTVEVDEDRLREAGISAAPEDIMAELAALADGRLSLQNRDHWRRAHSTVIYRLGISPQTQPCSTSRTPVRSLAWMRHKPDCPPIVMCGLIEPHPAYLLAWELTAGEWWAWVAWIREREGSPTVTWSACTRRAFSRWRRPRLTAPSPAAFAEPMASSSRGHRPPDPARGVAFG